MLGCFLLLGVGLSAQQTTLTAEDIQLRLERPVTLSTVPTRLPMLLTQLGSRIGVPIKCQSELNNAVVMVAVRNQPAKEVIERLKDNIGAGTAIQAGSLLFGMRVTTPEELAKLEKQRVRTMRSYIDNLLTSSEAEKDLDVNEMTRAADLALAFLGQDPRGGFRPAHPIIFTVATRSPMDRFTARLLDAIGPDDLARFIGDKPTFLDSKNLPEDIQRSVGKALGQLRKESDLWHDAFDKVQEVVDNTGNYGLPGSIADDSMPEKGVGLNGFRIAFYPEDSQFLVEVLSGKESVSEKNIYVPGRGSRWINPKGSYINPSQLPQETVAAPEDYLRLVTMANGVDGKPSPIDNELLSRISDPWKYDPLSFSMCSCLPELMTKLKLNLVAYLSDQGIYSVIYPFATKKEFTTLELMNYAGSMGIGQLRKDGEWLTSGPGNPENYLKNQMDRVPLGKFLKRAYEVGCLTLEEYADAISKLPQDGSSKARQLASLVRPGFDSLNPSYSFIEVYRRLTPGQRSLLRTSGLPISQLTGNSRRTVEGMSGVGRRRRFNGNPEGLYTDPPTRDELANAKMVLTTESTTGLLGTYGQQEDDNLYRRYMNYQFFDVAPYRRSRSNVDVNSVMNMIGMEKVRLCHRQTISMRINVPRKVGVNISGYQFDASMSQPAQNRDQFRNVIMQLLQG